MGATLGRAHAVEACGRPRGATLARRQGRPPAGSASGLRWHGGARAGCRTARALPARPLEASRGGWGGGWVGLGWVGGMGGAGPCCVGRGASGASGGAGPCGARGGAAGCERRRAVLCGARGERCERRRAVLCGAPGRAVWGAVRAARAARSVRRGASGAGPCCVGRGASGASGAGPCFVGRGERRGARGAGPCGAARRRSVCGAVRAARAAPGGAVWGAARRGASGAGPCGAARRGAVLCVARCERRERRGASTRWVWRRGASGASGAGRSVWGAVRAALREHAVGVAAARSERRGPCGATHYAVMPS